MAKGGRETKKPKKEKNKDGCRGTFDKGDGYLSSRNEEVAGCIPYPDRPRISTVFQTGKPLGRAETNTEG